MVVEDFVVYVIIASKYSIVNGCGFAMVFQPFPQRTAVEGEIVHSKNPSQTALLKVFSCRCEHCSPA